MRDLLTVLFCLLLAHGGFSQTDDIGSGHALNLNGTTQYISIGDHYDGVTLPVTVSAWVKVDGSLADWGPIFVSQNDPSDYYYEGFWLIARPTGVGVGYGDGHGSNDPGFRRSKTEYFSSPLLADTWVNITGVLRSALDMDIYLNGVNVGGSYTGTSDYPMSARSTSVAKIGNWYSNFVTYSFKGDIDEIRVYDRSLSQDEVRDQMCRKIDNTATGLIGHWMLNELSGLLAFDESSNHFDGTLTNNPDRVYSGAAIGDISTYLFPVSWTSQSLGLTGTDKGVDISSVVGNPVGIEIYMVTNYPSQTGGLPDGCIDQPYFGVFPSTLNLPGPSYTLTYDSNASSASSNHFIFSRAENSVATWNHLSDSLTLQATGRGEFIDQVGPSSLKIVGDSLLCDGFTGQIHVEGCTGCTFNWNTSASTDTITISSGGLYWVKGVTQCGQVTDSTEVRTGTIPSIDLGPDKTICVGDTLVLFPLTHCDCQYLWDNGTRSDSLAVFNMGTYTLMATNGCGAGVDSVAVDQYRISLDTVFIPNVITPTIGNRIFIVDSNLLGPLDLRLFNRWGKEIYESNNYKNDFDGSDLSSGVYFYLLKGKCFGTIKGSLSVIH